jgi:alpha-tubulin suppressor-like RCC1 family protein
MSLPHVARPRADTVRVAARRRPGALLLVIGLAACDPITDWDGRALICLLNPELPIELPCATKPRSIVDDVGFVAIAAGQDHTCALTADGRPYCWGRSVYTPIDFTTGAGIRTRPVPLASDVRLVSLIAGADHTCGLTAAGEAWCWGANHSGQLGTGTVDGDAWKGSEVPVRVAGDIVFAALGAGTQHTCGIDTEGAAYCWGMDFYGEIGRGVWEMESHPAPVRVVGDHVFTGIDGGQRFTCALAVNGGVLCWGHGHSGELGTLQTSICPDLFMNVRCSPWPIPIGADHEFVAVAGGSSFSCALAADGRTFCWGDNGQYQLGPGAGHGFTPRRVEHFVFSDIHVGGSTTCGTTAAGETLCWGGNWMGQLGTGSDEYAEVDPTPLAGGHRWSALSLGLSHACGITYAGATYCWGSNERGQLGVGVW